MSLQGDGLQVEIPLRLSPPPVLDLPLVRLIQEKILAQEVQKAVLPALRAETDNKETMTVNGYTVMILQ